MVAWRMYRATGSGYRSWLRPDGMTAGVCRIAGVFAMSTQTRAPATETQRLDLSRSRAQQPFVRDIWRNRCVCNNCFSDVAEVWVDTVRDTLGERVVEDYRLTDRGTIAHGLRDAPESVVSNYPLAKPRVTCIECGSVGLRANYDTLSKSDAVSLVEPLAARLNECGHDVALDPMYAAVRSLKSDPEYEAFDREIFAVAAYLGTKSR